MPLHDRQLANLIFCTNQHRLREGQACDYDASLPYVRRHGRQPRARHPRDRRAMRRRQLLGRPASLLAVRYQTSTKMLLRPTGKEAALNHNDQHG